MPGPPDALDRYCVLRSADVQEFRATVSKFLTPHRLTPLGRGADMMRFDVAAAPMGPISVIYGQHGGCELDALLTEQVDYVDVNMSWGGRNRITLGDRDEVVVDEHTAGIISPAMRARMRLSPEYRQLHLRIERFAVERRLEQLLGAPVTAPIRFRPAMDLRTPAAASWAQAVRLLVGDLGRPAGLADVTGGRNPWASFLIDGLLLAQAHNYSEQLAEPQHGPSRPAPVKRAIELIETEPESDLSAERLAAAAGVSARSLQRHFREHVGMSPREYVLQVRLARVRDELTTGQPGDGRTVADIALRWGFGHVSRFAGLYRKRFGESPSQTLRG